MWLRGNFIKYTRRVKLVRKSARPAGDKDKRLDRTKLWGGGKNLRNTSLPHQNPNELTVQYVTVQGTSTSGVCLQIGPGKRILSGKLSIAHCQSLPGITQPGARGRSQISKETKLLKIPSDGLQSAGHRQQGSERAPWILGAPKNYQHLHKILKKTLVQKGESSY